MRVGLFGIVFIVLLVLKLTHQVTLSWLWVTAPIWGGLVISVAIWFLLLCFMFIVDRYVD
jgi:hypothetical protein